MSLRRVNPKRDKNEPDIVRVAERMGATVSRLNGDGVPDLVLGFRHVITGTPCNLLVEVKSESGKLTESQAFFFDNWNGQAEVVRNPHEMAALLRDRMGYTMGAITWEILVTKVTRKYEFFVLSNSYGEEEGWKSGEELGSRGWEPVSVNGWVGDTAMGLWKRPKPKNP